MISVVLLLLYFPLLEHTFGRTRGKSVCRVRLVDAAGRNPPWGQAIIRTFMRQSGSRLHPRPFRAPGTEGVLIRVRLSG